MEAGNERIYCVVYRFINWIDLTRIKPMTSDKGLIEHLFMVFRSTTMPDKAHKLLTMAPATAAPLTGQSQKGES